MGFRQSSKNLKFNPTLQTSYVSGRSMGGVLTLSDAAIDQGAGITILSVAVIEKGSNKNGLTVVFFDELPSGTYTDNTAVTIADADIPKIAGFVTVVTADYVTVGGVSVARIQIPPMVVKLNTGKPLYALIVADGSITLGTTTALRINVGVLQD
jgi:hypothetical protein